MMKFPSIFVILQFDILRCYLISHQTLESLNPSGLCLLFRRGRWKRSYESILRTFGSPLSGIPGILFG